jgi:putative endonuclease
VRATTRETGRSGEELALAYLGTRGLALRARNYRCRQGEIDLIMSHRDHLVFVEVRRRRRGDYGGAAASIDAGKRRRIAACAERYLQDHPEHAGPCRFDVVAIEGDGPGARVDWIPGAFEL